MVNPRGVNLRTAVVTGAASGIGLALTQRLLQDGVRVAAVVRRDMPREAVLDQAIEDGTLRIYRGDLADAAARSDLVAELTASEPTIDALFNNAGVSTGTLQFSPQGRELHYEVNTIAPYVLAQGIRANLASAGGCIINTASDALFYDKRYDPIKLASPARFKIITGPYASSKLALALWSRALSSELAPQSIRILAVAPGAVDTPLIRGEGMPALLKPIARLISKPPAIGADLLLDGALSSYPTGSLIMKRRVRTLPFLDKAAQTLEIVAAAAER